MVNRLVLMHVRDCGICGSDLHAAKFGIWMPPDTIGGHEFSGEIAALGDGVVTSLPYMSCICPAASARRVGGATGSAARGHAGDRARDVAFALAYSHAEFAEALCNGTIDVAPLVTDVIDLADVPDAFRALDRPTTQCKVLIEFA